MRNIHESILFTIIISFQTAFAQPETELQKLVADDRASTDFFGYSVSIDEDYAIVGAYNEDEDASGGNTITNAGSAYIFERTSEGSWQQKAKLVASDRSAGDFFGISVSISGNYAIVGSQQDVDDGSGNNTLTVAGSAFIYERDDSGQWIETAKLIAGDRASSDFFGDAVSIDGDYAIVGARTEDQDADGENFLDNAGSAYVFKRAIDGTWNELTKLVASDREAFDNFGASVAIDKNYVIVGANQEDEDVNGENTATQAGAAYVFKRIDDDTWTEVAKLVASDRETDDLFGYPVAISGDQIVIGAWQEDEDSAGENSMSRSGSAYVFERSEEDNWSESTKLVASDRSAADFFGISVAISKNYVVIGAYQNEDEDNGETTGAAYVFGRSADGEWAEKVKLIASDRASDDEFGFAVAMDGADVFIGANREDEDENSDNTANAAGSVYIFKLPLNTVSVTESACESFEFDDTMLTSSGTYTATFMNTAGYDSLVTLNLSILNATYSEEKVEACENYEWNGITYTQSGTYEELFTNKAGCDSTAILNLIISDPAKCITLSASNKRADIIVSPNPTRSFISVQGVEINATYYLRNISGKIIQEGVISGSKLDIHADAGTYFLTIPSVHKTMKIIKLE